MKHCNKCGLWEGEWRACEEPDCGELVNNFNKYLGNTQRLKFAWARGARIQLLNIRNGLWIDLYRVPEFEGDVTYRIHPDDEHLQYGPLTTALRNTVLYDYYNWTNEEWAARAYFKALEQSENRSLAGWAQCNEMYEFQMLMIAEQLADEGL